MELRLLKKWAAWWLPKSSVTDGDHTMFSNDGPANGEFSFQVLNPNKHREARERRWLEAKLKQARNTAVSEIHPLSPELAALLLARNEDNRTVAAPNLAHLVADLQSGRWAFNGESIIVSKDGLLNDGQHRCMAVIESGVTVPQQLFCFGVERETRTTVDGGSARTPGDYLAMEGFKNGNLLGSTASLVIQIERHGRPITGAGRPSKQEVLDRCRTDDAIEAAVDAVNKTAARKVASITVLATAYYFVSRNCADEADEFIDKLIHGQELRARDPILVLREKLRSPDNKLTNTERLHAIFRAWNLWKQGKQVKTIKHLLRRGEKLPEIR